MSEPSPSSLSRKEAAARAAADRAREERRTRAIRLSLTALVLLVSAGIIGLALWAANSDGGDGGNTPPAPNPSAALPTGVLGPESDYPYAVPLGEANPAAPVLQIWEDFQCPGCGAVETINGQTIASLGQEGQVRLLYRPATFLDRLLNNDASARATSAWGCAIDAGKTYDYHQAVFTNQPQVEGEGWTNEQLISLGQQVGIEGPDLDTFTRCVTEGTYLQWAANSNEQFSLSGVSATPTGILNGVTLTPEQLASPTDLPELVKQAQP